jgi:diaminohydroxyphosphoribosylaminopyrimidine deaminase/5-amino-6-(5-phosphoribosylamino)uracil reductase
MSGVADDFSEPLRLCEADPLLPIRSAPADRPLVVAQLGQSLDGRIATISGESKYINGSAALDHLHRLRSVVDAIVVGAGTVEADDPQLTVRRVAGRNPARVVIDPRGRLCAGQRWQNCDGAQLYVITAADRVACGAEMIRVRAQDGGVIAPAAIVEALFARGLKRILIEGGARTISHFVDAGCIDRLHILMAPVIIGSGRTGLDLAPIRRLQDALRPKTTAFILKGQEVLFDCALKEPQSKDEADDDDRAPQP